MKKILVVGGSENFVNENNHDYHYLTLLEKHGEYDINNISLRGISCDEIFYRVIPEVERTNYDLVLILWVPLDRKWVYFSDDNVNDYTIINHGTIKGFKKDSSACEQYSKLHYAYFNNQYINVQRYLTQILAIQNYMKTKNTPLLMYRDNTDDLVNDLLNVTYSEKSGFVNLTPALKQLIDFKHRPDHYVLEKINALKLLLEKIDRSCWIDFENFQFSARKVDHQPNDGHAGPLTHSNFFQILIAELTKKNLA